MACTARLKFQRPGIDGPGAPKLFLSTCILFSLVSFTSANSLWEQNRTGVFSPVKGDGRVNLFSRRPSRFAAIQRSSSSAPAFWPINNFPDGIHDRLRVVPQALCSGHLLDEAFMQVVPPIVRRTGNVISRPLG